MFWGHTVIRQGAVIAFACAFMAPVCRASQAIDVMAQAVYQPISVVRLIHDRPAKKMVNTFKKRYLLSYEPSILSKRRYNGSSKQKKKKVGKRRLTYFKRDKEKINTAHLQQQQKARAQPIVQSADNSQTQQKKMSVEKSVQSAVPIGMSSTSLLNTKSGAERLLPLDITVNHKSVGQWLLLERDGVFYTIEDAFKEWNLERPKDIQTVQAHYRAWLALSFLPGFDIKFNDAEQSAALFFSPNAFVQTTIEREPQPHLKTSHASLAAFANYDFSFTDSHVRSDAGTSSRNLGGLFELGISNDLGVLTSSYIGQNLASQDPATPKSFRRVETVFSRDYPDNNTTLRLGDSTTHTDVFGNGISFSGFQLVRNFTLQPGFITQPIPSIRGASTTPSSVDLYINEVLRQTTNVPPGPFTIDNLPVLTDGGDIRLVVTDALGRQTVVTQPFFTSPNLLEQGLSDWGVQVGWVHNNVGIDSNDYGPGFMSAQWRKGITKSLTTQAGLDLSVPRKRVTAGVEYGLPFQALGTFSVAGTQDNVMGVGEQWQLGLQKTTPTQNFSLTVQGADSNYQELGWNAGTLPNHLQISSSYSYNSASFGTFGVAFARVNTFNQGTLSTVSASYSVHVGERGSLSFVATKVSGQTSGATVGISLFFPLEKGVTLAASATQSDGNLDTYVSASRPLTTNTGSSWRVLAGTRAGDAYSEGGYYYQGNKGLFSVDASASGTQQTMRLETKGGLVMMDSQMFASRQIQNSFALVEVPGYANVGVSAQSGNSSVTNADGKAFIVGLQPYQENRLQLDPKTLPVSAELNNLEQIVVPRALTGVKVIFPVNTGRSALIQIVLDEDKQPAPIGAEIELLGTDKTFFVARKGLAFVTDLQANNQLRMKWNNKMCDLSVTLPATKQDDITRIGPLVCAGVTR